MLISVAFYILLVAAFLISFIAFVFLTRGRRPIANILAWLLFMFLVPYVGIPLFLIIGQRKLTWITDKKREIYHPKTCALNFTNPIERLICTFGAPAATDNNNVKLLTDGIATYHLIVEKISQAKSSILISTYRITNDQVGSAIVKLLTEKAKQGIQVCLLLDTVGTFLMFPRRKLKPLRKAGGSVRYIMPLFHTPFRGRVNLRDHRKIMVFDGHEAIVGGMNLAKEYMGPKPYAKRWDDLNLLICGGAVASLIAIFESDWKFAASNMEYKSYQRPQISDSQAGNALIQMIASGPDTVGDPLYDSIISSIYDAKKSIYIITPYFVLDDALQKAFMIAVRGGIDVNIIIPGKSNHPITDLVRSISIRKLHKAGAKIWFTKKMIHAKAMIFDDTLGIVGSANLDMRSLLLNFEISCFLYSKPEIANLQNWVNSLLPNCTTTFKKPSLGRMWLEDAAQLLKPLL